MAHSKKIHCQKTFFFTVLSLLFLLNKRRSASQKLGNLREGLQAPLQNPRHIGNEDTVVGHGHPLLPGPGRTRLHFPFVEHTGPTVDDKLVLGQLLGEIPRRW